MLDREGRVIGIVQGGVVGAQVNFAIPVGRLTELLQTPVILLTTPALYLEDARDPSRLERSARSGDTTRRVEGQADPRTRARRSSNL